MIHSFQIFLEALIFIYLCRLIGGIIFKFLKTNLETTTERTAYSIIAGLGTMGVIGLVLATFGIFTAPAIWSVFIVLALLASKTIAADIAAIKNIEIKKIFASATFLKIIIVIWLTANLLIVFVPLTGHDTLDYHLPIIQDIISSKQLTFNQEISPYAYLPVLGEIIYALPTVAFGETNAPYVFQIIQFNVLILFAAITFAFVKRRTQINWLPAATAIALLAIMPLEREVLHGGYIDVLGFIFSIGSLFLVINNVFGGKFNRRQIIFAALLAGFAASIKYTSLFFVGIESIILLWAWRKELIIYLLVAGAVMSPWYVKNTVVFGNPVYPMLENQQFTEAVGMFMVIDRTLPNAFIFPVYKFGQWFTQENQSSSDLVILGYLIALYGLIASAIIFRRKFSPTEIILFLTLETYLLVLFFTSHQTRFLLPALILLPPLLAMLTEKMLGEREKLLRWFYPIICVAAIILLLGNFHYFKVKNYYLLGIYDQKEYIIEIGGQ
ncbi:MAG: hypothetical protein WC673_01285 [Candidatus Paceibacterota bacterium]|jgi:hypothetical protein